MVLTDAPANVENASGITRDARHLHGRKLNRILGKYFSTSSQPGMHNLLQLSCRIRLKVDSNHACRCPSALSQKRSNCNLPSRERTRPDMTRSGRSMVLATASTTNFAPVRVGQLKKLYTTSCFAVINWSNSSIKTTLHPISADCSSSKVSPLTRHDHQVRCAEATRSVGINVSRLPLR